MMQVKLETQPTFEAVDSTLNGLDLLMMIRDLVYKFHSQMYLLHLIHEAMRQLATFQQGKGVTVATYQEQFQNFVEVASHMGASEGLHAGVVVEVAAEMGINCPMSAEMKLLLHQQPQRSDFW
jgi:hypothetical protein